MRAICTLQCAAGVQHGIVRLFETQPGRQVQVEIKIDGILPGVHGFHVHRSGDISDGGDSTCDHFNPTGEAHGDLNAFPSHVGDLGNVYANRDGRVRMRLERTRLRLRGDHSVLGRALIVHSDPDDLGRTSHPESSTTGNSGGRILWGVIGLDPGC